MSNPYAAPGPPPPPHDPHAHGTAPPGQAPWGAPPPPAPPAVRQGGWEYHQIHRLGRQGWWWPLIGLVSFVVGYLVISMLVTIPFALGFFIAGGDVQQRLQDLADTAQVTPLDLAFLNLTLAAAIPVVVLVTFVVHGLKPRWVSSVLPRMRWRWMLTCFGLAFLALLATLVVSAVVPSQDPGLGDGLQSFTSTTRDFLLVILFLTPLQAAGEEYVFRGYLTQAFGRLFDFSPWAGRVAAVVLPAFLFALAHGAQDAPIFFDRFVFGLTAGILVILTGGLEAGIAMHVLNNFLAYGLALAYTDMSSALNPTGGSWSSIVVTLTQQLVFLALVVLVARRRGIGVKTSDPVPAGYVFEGPDPRV